MDGRSASKYLAVDFNISSISKFKVLPFELNTSFITFRQLRSWYILIESKLALFALHSLSTDDDDDDDDDDEEEDHTPSTMTEHGIAALNVLDTADQLHVDGLYDEALALRAEFDLDRSPVFDVMVNRLLFGGDIDGGKLEWHDLGRLLVEYDGAGTQYKYTLGVVESILTLTAASRTASAVDGDAASSGNVDAEATPFELPSFVMQRIQSLEERKDVDLLLLPLVEMLCRFGLILEGVRTLCFALDRAQRESVDVATEHRYHYQQHSVWKTAHRVYAQCNALHLEPEQNTLIKAMAHWVQGAH